MDGKYKWCEKLKAFRIIYYILIVSYIVVVLILLGVTFDIDFLDTLQHSLINKYGNITTPVLILTTIILFIPFTVTVAVDSLHTAEEIESIYNDNLTKVDTQIKIASEACRQNEKDLYVIKCKTLEVEKEKLELSKKMLQVERYSSKLKSNDAYINKQLNIIATHSPLYEESELITALDNYYQSLDKLKEHLQN